MVELAQKELVRLVDDDNKYTAKPKIFIGSIFDNTSYDGVFDGIWCNAVVVHVPRSKFSFMLANMYTALAEDGILYISALKGSGSSTRREGRVFFYYNPNELVESFELAGFKIIDSWSENIDVSSKEKTKKRMGTFLIKKINCI